MDTLSDIYKTLLPVNGRFYLESLLGKTDPITEKDFSEEDLKLLKSEAVSKYITVPANVRAMQQGQERAGVEVMTANPINPQVSYGDYRGRPDNSNWAQALIKSYTSPEFRIGTSLGNFGIKDRGDHYEAYDTYNWNGDFDKQIKTLQDLWNQTKFSKPTSILNGLAELYAPKVNRPVNIKIPK